MAKYIGLISSDARGKIGGAVLSRSRSGTTLKARTTPKRPNTPAQVSAQSAISAANLAWKSLDDDHRTTWSVFAATITWSNSLGGTYSPTGQQLYTQAFINAGYFGEVPPSTFPTSYTPPFVLSDVYCTVRDTELILGIEGTITTPDWYWLCFCGRFVHRSVNYTSTKARAFMGAGINTTSLEIFSPYVLRFGQVPPVDTNLPVRVVPLSSSAFISGTIWNSPILAE